VHGLNLFSEMLFDVSNVVILHDVDGKRNEPENEKNEEATQLTVDLTCYCPLAPRSKAPLLFLKFLILRIIVLHRFVSF
jgi:hypothetical protein